jgi:hypothetical protein
MLESLENNELILLMYLAGELPAMDRQEVEQMLAADAGLRRELEQVLSMVDGLQTGLAGLDAAEAMPSEALAVRRIGRAMRQHFADRAAQAARIAKPASRRAAFPWWAYPSVAAAVIFIAFLTWVISFNFANHQLAGLPPATQGIVPADPIAASTPSTIPVPDVNSAQLAQEIESSFGPSTEKEDNQMFALGEDPQAGAAAGSDKND